MVAKWPYWPYPTTCGGGPAFDPVSAFSGPTEAETGPGPAEEGLRKTIEEWQTGYPTLPKRHWRPLSQEPGVVVYAHGRLPGVEELTLEESDGLWDFASYSSRCEPASIVDDRQAITWTLSSKQSRLRPSTRRLWIDLGPGECASGRSQNDRALKPVFFELGKRLMMVMRLKPLPPGSYTCEGIFEPPLRVKLPKRLGDRVLFVGGAYPPSRAVLPRHRQGA
ncbi:MAG: hypothetical protein QOF85_725 [Solirubrobacterales bacterium]|jgi:hypothetical protein|nr:hypothetical protein [Solirubrobacterales bacterium]